MSSVAKAPSGPKTSATGLKGALDLLNGGALAASAAQRQWQAAVDGAKTAVDGSSTSLDNNTAAGRTNTQALDQMITSAQNHAAASDLSAQQTAALRQQIIDTAVELGFSREKTEEYVDSLFKIPGDVKTNVSTPGATLSRQQIRELQDALTSLPKEVRTKVITEHLELFNATGSTNAAGANDKSLRRWGGIDYAFARGGVTPAHIASGTRIKYAEPATGGEAYVPRKGRRGRSLAILAEAASWYGARLMTGSDKQNRAMRPSVARYGPGLVPSARRSVDRAHAGTQRANDDLGRILATQMRDVFGREFAKHLGAELRDAADRRPPIEVKLDGAVLARSLDSRTGRRYDLLGRGG